MFMFHVLLISSIMYVTIMISAGMDMVLIRSVSMMILHTLLLKLICRSQNDKRHAPVTVEQTKLIFTVTMYIIADTHY